VLLPEGRGIAPSLDNLLVGLHPQKYTRGRLKDSPRDYTDTSRPGGPHYRCVAPSILATVNGRGKEPAPMDPSMMIMFASVLCTMTALSFMELRRIRKKLEAKPEAKLESK